MLQIRSWHLRLAVLLLATAVSAKRLPIRAFTTADGQIVVLYANGFGPTSVPAVSGSQTQSGTLAPLPSVTVGGVKATVQFAGLSAVGEFQFNVVLPSFAARWRSDGSRHLRRPHHAGGNFDHHSEMTLCFP